MAHFYGGIQGTRGEATRLGSKDSGLQVFAASWEGRVAVYFSHDEETGRDMAHVEMDRHHGSGTGRVLYVGPVGSYEPPHAPELEAARAALEDAAMSSRSWVSADVLRALVDALSDPLSRPAEHRPSWQNQR